MGNSKVIESSISYSDHWVRLSAPRRYLSSHIPLKSFQWVWFKVWNSGRSRIRPPVAVPVYKLRSARIRRALWFEVWAVSSDGRKSSWKGKNYFNISSKNRIKTCIGLVWEGVFFSQRVWFKTDTQCYSQDLSLLNCAHVSALEAKAALDCVTSCEFSMLSLMKYRAQCQPARLLPLINLISLRGWTPWLTSGLSAPTPHSVVWQQQSSRVRLHGKARLIDRWDSSRAFSFYYS